MKRKCLALLLALTMITANVSTVFAATLISDDTELVEIQDIDEEDGVSEIEESDDIVTQIQQEQDSDNLIVDDVVEPIDSKDDIVVRDYVGLNESDIEEDVLTNDNVIVTYTVDDKVKEGTVLRQLEEDDKVIIEVATEPVVTSSVAKFNLLNTFELMNDMTEPPSMENGNWGDYPVSYEYNWDNSQSCWNWGEWFNGQKYTTPYGTYDNNVRHAMGMYCDGENIHLHISFAKIYTAIANGDDYNFYIDGVGAKMRVLYADNGAGITGQRRQPGTYDVVVVNGDHWNSGYEANGSYGTMTVKDNNINNELEIVIPLETLKLQNSSINLDNIQNIEFFTPNLMYRHISCGGASTGSTGFIVMTIIVFGLALAIYQKKDYFNMPQLQYGMG